MQNREYPSRYTFSEVRELRRQLMSDAEQAKREASAECRPEWVDPSLWSKYTGKGTMPLYFSFSNNELLDILRAAAAELGRLPTQKEIFCVYRIYIRRRFKNWPTALKAAGLKQTRTAP